MELKSSRLAIIIPAKNEEERIKPTLEHYLNFFENRVSNNYLKSFCIFPIINNSSDRTLDIVRELLKHDSRLEYLNLKKGGKGYAVREGFKLALKRNYNFLGFVDADESTKPFEFYRLAHQLQEYDGVIASRYMQGASLNPEPSLKRRVASRLFNAEIRALFPNLNYQDTQCGAKIFRREAIGKIIDKLKINGWAFDVELLYYLKKANKNIIEMPTVWSESKLSKINVLSAGYESFLNLLYLRLRNSPMKFMLK